jgi:hypothetical protein
MSCGLLLPQSSVGINLSGCEGTMLGAILGAAIVGVMINGMVLVNLSSYLQDIVLGFGASSCKPFCPSSVVVCRGNSWELRNRGN